MSSQVQIARRAGAEAARQQRRQPVIRRPVAQNLWERIAMGSLYSAERKLRQFRRLRAKNSCVTAIEITGVKAALLGERG